MQVPSSTRARNLGEADYGDDGKECNHHCDEKVWHEHVQERLLTGMQNGPRFDFSERVDVHIGDKRIKEGGTQRVNNVVEVHSSIACSSRSR